MISNPKFGWCNFNIDNFSGHPSYLTDVPVDLLDAFIDYYTRGYGVAIFDEEGSFFTLVLTRYNWGIFLIEEKNDSVLYDFSDMDSDNLAKELISDIENDLNGWTVEFVVDDDQEEIAQYRNEIRQRIAKLKKLIW